MASIGLKFGAVEYRVSDDGTPTVTHTCMSCYKAKLELQKEGLNSRANRARPVPPIQKHRAAANEVASLRVATTIQFDEEASSSEGSPRERFDEEVSSPEGSSRSYNGEAKAEAESAADHIAATSTRMLGANQEVESNLVVGALGGYAFEPRSKAERNICVDDWLDQHKASVGNGSHHSRVAKHSPEMVPGLLTLVRSLKNQVEELVDECAKARHAQQILVDSNLPDYFEMLSDSVIYGTAPSTHLFWLSLRGITP